MNFSKNQIILMGAALLIVLVLIGIAVVPAFQKGGGNDKTKITGALSIWGVSKSRSELDTVIASFNAVYPKVTVSYRNFETYGEYQQALLEALASISGPDIFMIRNTDLPRMINKIVPIGSDALPAATLLDAFPQVVRQDFVQQNYTYALPLSIDTLALYYNRNLLDQATVAAPQTWEDFSAIIPKLTKYDSSGKITQSGAAIGSSVKSITDAPSILELLMLQNGTAMVSPDFSNATFANSPEGVNALKFYTQFSDTRSKTYAWNDGFANDRDAFAQEKTAMMFGFASAIPDIKARNAFLNFGVIPAPQPANAAVANRVSFPQYYGLAVSRQSQQQALAWEFIMDVTMSPTAAQQYFAATRKPPALKSVAITDQNDVELGAFARQTLTARSWPQIDEDTISAALSQAIMEVNTNAAIAETALRKAQDAVTALMGRK
ncbi:MAG: extracellular solute-binding protein [Candidatus Jorgensenbacteria bacterium]|nr:extracellular solute-binding protein [Candidatus Jorgensenbacteria bacterium]